MSNRQTELGKRWYLYIQTRVVPQDQIIKYIQMESGQEAAFHLIVNTAGWLLLLRPLLRMRALHLAI